MKKALLLLLVLTSLACVPASIPGVRTFYLDAALLVDIIALSDGSVGVVTISPNHDTLSFVYIDSGGIRQAVAADTIMGIPETVIVDACQSTIHVAANWEDGHLKYYRWTLPQGVLVPEDRPRQLIYLPLTLAGKSIQR